MRLPRIALLTLLLTVPLSASAQQDSSPIKADARALVFSIDPNFTLGSFEGSTISYKRHRSESAAVRVGLSFSGGYSAFDQDRDASNLDQEGDNANAGVSASLYFLRYTRSRTSVHLYYGAGPTFSAGRSSGDVTTEYGIDGDVTQAQRFVLVGAGVSGIVGVEWPATDWLSVLAEYGQTVRYSYTHTTNEIDFQNNSDNDNKAFSRSDHTISTGPSGVRFGLSVFF